MIVLPVFERGKVVDFRTGVISSPLFVIGEAVGVPTLRPDRQKGRKRNLKTSDN